MFWESYESTNLVLLTVFGETCADAEIDQHHYFLVPAAVSMASSDGIDCSSINSDRAVLSKMVRSVYTNFDPPNFTCFLFSPQRHHHQHGHYLHGLDTTHLPHHWHRSYTSHVPTTTSTPTYERNGADDCSGSAMRSVPDIFSFSFILNFDWMSFVCSG